MVELFCMLFISWSYVTANFFQMDSLFINVLQFVPTHEEKEGILYAVYIKSSV